MTVGRICSREVDLAAVTDTAQAAAHRMLQRQVGTLLVQNDERKPVGIVTDRDLAMKVLAHALDANSVTVGEIMTENPQVVAEDSPIEGALAAMRTARCRRLPVVDASNELCGIISLDDVLVAFSRETRAVSELVTDAGPRRLAEGWAE